ncbi:hypothetical protein COP2_014301 [Malus domestica]
MKSKLDRSIESHDTFRPFTACGFDDFKWTAWHAQTGSLQPCCTKVLTNFVHQHKEKENYQLKAEVEPPIQIHGQIYVIPRPSGFVHQHLASSVRINTKSYVGSFSIFHLTTVEPSQPHHYPP